MKNKEIWILILLIGLFLVGVYFLIIYDKPKTEEIQQCCSKVKKILIENEEKGRIDEIEGAELPSVAPFDRAWYFCECVGGEIIHVPQFDTSIAYCKTGLTRQKPSKYYLNKCAL